MKLPGLEKAAVPERKVREYLLSRTHPGGRAKAAFFLGLGFRSGNWRELGKALLRHAAEHEVAACEESRFGTRYVIDGRLNTPGGKHPVVRVIWFVDRGAGEPRLVTAYPGRQGAAP